MSANSEECKSALDFFFVFVDELKVTPPANIPDPIKMKRMIHPCPSAIIELPFERVPKTNPRPIERGKPMEVSGYDNDLLFTDSPRIPAMIRWVDFLNLSAKKIPDSTHNQAGNCQAKIYQNVKSMTIN